MSGHEPDSTGGSAVSLLVRRLREGDRSAFDRLFPLVYDHLHSMARIQRGRWPDRDSLNTTALLHEAYIRLAGQDRPDWRDRAHFLAVAATAMRQILIDHARSRLAVKRGGNRRRVGLDEIRHRLEGDSGFTDERAELLVALERSMQRLRAANLRQYRIVECRYFAGMTIDDTAEAVGISAASVKRGWSMARAWLYRDLKESLESDFARGSTSDDAGIAGTRDRLHE